jgi:hypothetical protein
MLMLHLCTQGTETKPVRTERFVIGVNYWPRKLGLDLWRRFDVDVVQEDFALLSELGVGQAKINLVWEDFQSKPESLRCAALAHLLALCDAASAENLKLELSLMGGHLDGVNCVPSWLLDSAKTRASTYPTLCKRERVEQGIRCPWSDPLAHDASVHFAEGIAKAVGGHSAIAAYNLGNEPEKLGKLTEDDSFYLWLDELKDAVTSIDPRHPVTCTVGAHHLSTQGTLRLDRVFSKLDFCSIKGQVETPTEPNGTQEQRAAFTIALARQLTQKPVQFIKDVVSVEPSHRRPPPDHPSIAQHLELLLPYLVSQGARGIYAYSYSDVATSELAGFQRSPYGLFDETGQLKPVGTALKGFATACPKVIACAKSAVPSTLSPDRFYESPETQVKELFLGFLNG